MKPDAFQVNGITVNLIDDAENYLLLVEFFSVLQQRTYSKNYSMMVRLISYNTKRFGGSMCILQRKFEICY